MAASTMSCISVFGRLLRKRLIEKQTLLSLRGDSQVCWQISRLHSHWHLVGAVCLQRKPIVSQELLPMEKEFQAYVDTAEAAGSLLSDFELKERYESKRLSKKKESKTELKNTETKSQKSGLGETKMEAAEDFVDKAETELRNFQPAPRITEADLRNDIKSLQRHLDKNLTFLVQHRLGNDIRWGLPQAVRVQGETMKQVAERVCREVCGEKLNAVFLGNAPVGYCKYKYPKAARVDGILGAKVFFFKAWHRNGDVCKETFAKNPETSDYMWATRSEVVDSISQKDYCKTVLSLLVDEDYITDEAEEESDSQPECQQNVQASN